MHVRMCEFLLCLLVNLPLCVLSFIVKVDMGLSKFSMLEKWLFFWRSRHSWEVLEFPRLYFKVEVSVDWVIFSSFIFHGCKYAVCHVDRVWHTSVSGSFVEKRDHTCLCICRHDVWVGKESGRRAFEIVTQRCSHMAYEHKSVRALCLARLCGL